MLIVELANVFCLSDKMFWIAFVPVSTQIQCIHVSLTLNIPNRLFLTKKQFSIEKKTRSQVAGGLKTEFQFSLLRNTRILFFVQAFVLMHRPRMKRRRVSSSLLPRSLARARRCECVRMRSAGKMVNLHKRPAKINECLLTPVHNSGDKE